MTKPLITLPCTARELENALRSACDFQGLWNAEIRASADDGALILTVETETNEATQCKN